MPGTITFEEARKELSFAVHREPAVTKLGQREVERDAIIRNDTGEILGVVPQRHDLITYDNLVGWVKDALDTLRLPFELHESKLRRNGAQLYQEYVLDGVDVTSPDTQPMKPMIFIDAQYSGGSQKIGFGTWRLICSNVARVKRAISQIAVKSGEILNSSVADEIRMKLDRFAQVSNIYTKLGESTLANWLWTFLKDDQVSFLFKREVINYLATDQVAEIIPQRWGKKDMVAPETVIRLVNEKQTAWYLYNVLTAVASHQMRSVNARVAASMKIAKYFGL